MSKKKILILIMMGILLIILGVLLFIINNKKNNTEEINEDNSIPVYKEENSSTDSMPEKEIQEFENVNDYLNKYVGLSKIQENENGAKSIVSGSVSYASKGTITISYVEIKIVDKDGKLVEILRLEDEFELTNEQKPIYYELNIDYSEDYTVSIDFYKHKQLLKWSNNEVIL